MNWQLILLIAGKIIKTLLSPEFNHVIRDTRLFCETVKTAWADRKITIEEIQSIVKSADNLSDAIKELIKAQGKAG